MTKSRCWRFIQPSSVANKRGRKSGSSYRRPSRVERRRTCARARRFAPGGVRARSTCGRKLPCRSFAKWRASRGKPGYNTGATILIRVPLLIGDCHRFFERQLFRRPLDRLSLARWLVDRDNPLTARVVANRYWEALFGHGLVATSEDFGSQGQPPTHPELLDWLAVKFMDSGWDRRALIRTMVTSAVYRQSSQVAGDAAKLDPDNRWLGGSARAAEREMIRDQALAVSGLLSKQDVRPTGASRRNRIWDSRPLSVVQPIGKRVKAATATGEPFTRAGVAAIHTLRWPHSTRRTARFARCGAMSRIRRYNRWSR